MKEQKNENLFLISLSMSVLLASVGTSMANIALPTISSALGTSFSNVRWVVLSYLLASTFFSLIVGQIGDRYGHQKVLFAGTVMYAMGSFLCGSSSSLTTLVLARVLQGMGGAALISLPIAIATEALHKEKTGRAIGLLSTMSAVGTASGPSIGGFLLGASSWRAAFFMMTGLGLLSLLLLLKLDSPVTAVRNNRNKGGSFSLVAKEIYLHPHMRVQLLSNLAVSAVMMTTLIAGPFYLTHGLHIESGQMGLVMSAGPITSALFGFLSGQLTDRWGSLRIIKFGLLQLLIGALSFVLLPSLFGVIGFALCAVLLSLGYQLFLSANSSSIIKKASMDRRGFVSGALSLTRNLGLMGGTYLMGGIFDFFAGASDTSRMNSEAVSRSLQITFSVAAALVAFLLIYHFKKQKRRNNETRFAQQIH